MVPVVTIDRRLWFLWAVPSQPLLLPATIVPAMLLIDRIRGDHTIPCFAKKKPREKKKKKRKKKKKKKKKGKEKEINK